MVTNDDHLMLSKLLPNGPDVTTKMCSLFLVDFGLAKQKQRELSMMESVVGTMAYWW